MITSNLKSKYKFLKYLFKHRKDYKFESDIIFTFLVFSLFQGFLSVSILIILLNNFSALVSTFLFPSAHILEVSLLYLFAEFDKIELWYKNLKYKYDNRKIIRVKDLL